MSFEMNETNAIIPHDAKILITGAGGFVGSRVVGALLDQGYGNLRCLVRPSSDQTRMREASSGERGANVEVLVGNLLSRDDCREATRDVSVICHLAAGVGKSFPDCYMNSVIGTRNLMDACLEHGVLKRFVNVSSFSVYSNADIPRGGLLDETCPLEPDPKLRHEPYVYGKVLQDQLVFQYAETHGIPYTIMRPSVVFGPGKVAIPARVGVDTFGFYMQLGGGLPICITYVDNCADALALACFKPGVEGEVINITDDDLPTGSEFLRAYKKRVHRMFSLYVPYPLFRLFCHGWEKYSKWSQGQLPPVFNRLRCAGYWKGNRYSNRKLKEKLGWQPRVPMHEALDRYFEYQKKARSAK